MAEQRLLVSAFGKWLAAEDEPVTELIGYVVELTAGVPTTTYVVGVEWSAPLADVGGRVTMHATELGARNWHAHRADVRKARGR